MLLLGVGAPATLGIFPPNAFDVRCSGPSSPVSIVSCSLGRVGENGVGLNYEAVAVEAEGRWKGVGIGTRIGSWVRRGGRGLGRAVRMVELNKFVEATLRVGCRGVKLENFVGCRYGCCGMGMRPGKVVRWIWSSRAGVCASSS